MKASATIFALLLLAGVASAQESPRPDFSREAVQRFVMDLDLEDEQEPFDRPSVTLRGLGTTWNLNLPGIVMPLAGTRLGVTQEWPNAFALTNTAIATSPRAMARYRRDVSRELRRINKRLNASIDVN